LVNNQYASFLPWICTGRNRPDDDDPGGQTGLSLLEEKTFLKKAAGFFIFMLYKCQA
jgi:hypothetical protein